MKLKNATDEELQMLDNFLLSITGQQFENEKQVILNYSKYMPLLIDVFGETTIEEVKMAYKLAKAGKLTNHKDEQFVLYRELNFASASEVILAFEEYKKEQLGAVIQNQKLFLSESEILAEEKKRQIEVNGLREFLADSWALCEKNKINNSTGVLLYDSLRQRNLIGLTNEEKLEIREAAKQIVLENAEYNRKESDDTATYRKWDNLIKSLMDDSDEVTIMSKKLALQSQIRNWIFEERTLEEIQNLIN